MPPRVAQVTMIIKFLLTDADVILRIFSSWQSWCAFVEQSNYFKLRRLSWAGSGERRYAVIMYDDRVASSRRGAVGRRSTHDVEDAFVEATPARCIYPSISASHCSDAGQWRHSGGYLGWKVQLVPLTWIFYRSLRLVCGCSFLATTRWSVKTYKFYFYDNFDKCGLILTIFSHCCIYK